MSSTKRWKEIMDFYYSNLSTNFLKGDLQHAGFRIKNENRKHSSEETVTDNNLEITVKEVAASDEDQEHLIISVDNTGRLIDVI